MGTHLPHPLTSGGGGGGSLKSTWWHSCSLGLISPCNILRIHTPAGMPFFVLFPDVRIFYCSSWKMKFTFLFKIKKIPIKGIPIPNLCILNFLIDGFTQIHRKDIFGISYFYFSRFFISPGWHLCPWQGDNTISYNRHPTWVLNHITPLPLWVWIPKIAMATQPFLGLIPPCDIMRIDTPDGETLPFLIIDIWHGHPTIYPPTIGGEDHPL